MDETSISPRLRTAMIKVRLAQQGVQAAIQAEFDAVAAARRSGVTWQAIGDAYGCTRQAAAQRWPQPVERPW